MKIKQLFALRFSRLSLFTVAAVALILTTACNADKSEEAAILLAASSDYCCTPDDHVDFPLESHLPTSGNFDYVTEVETGPYTLSECMCQIQEFGFIFHGVDPDWNISILDSQGNAITFQLSIDENGTAHIVIPNPQDLPDENLTVSFDFESEGERPTPTLEHAGGLCIVENVVGTDDKTLVRRKPYKQTVAPTPGNSFSSVYIPSGIGGPPY